jgi:hypothetical protein
LETVTQYKTEMAALKANLDAVETEADDSGRSAKAQKAREHLKAKQKKRGPKTKFDPNDMPHKRLEADPNNKPKLRKEDFTTAGLFNNPYVKLAASGTFTFDKLAGANDPAYLAATTEVTLTPAIEAKAAELEHNPVKIYQWVRNSIEWVPSWGSIQGADLTLRSLRGNSFDTSSLLVALLRASGIPARYAHGTAEIPEDKFRNWAGAFSDTNAAWDFVSAGGVPVVAVTSGGKVTKFRMEHVWVEAAIDFYPSRGAVNKSADAWVSLDATLKDYIDIPGFDATAAVPFDQYEYLSQLREENPVDWYMRKLQAYLDGLPAPKALGEAMGQRLIKRDGGSVLPAALPYKVLVTANRYGAIPAALKTTIDLAIADATQTSTDGVSFGTVDVAGKRLTLVYEPATSADRDLIAQYGGDMYAVPPYMLYLAPTILADGVPVYRGPAVQMGQEQVATLSYRGPTLSAQGVDNRLIAGGYYAIGLNLQGMSAYVVGDKNLRLNQTLARLDPDNIKNDELIGEHLYAMALFYFYMNDGAYRGAAKLFNVAETRPVSAGFAAFAPTVSYFFGIPRSVTLNKAQVDIGLELAQASARDGNAAKLQTYMTVRGLMGSHSEHRVWEAVHGFEGVSAVKGLQAAYAQGIPVHTIDQSNFDTMFPLLSLAPEDKQEIAEGIRNGLIAIAPQSEITLNDWHGAGFIIKDPTTAGGIYRISGGLSGGSTTKAGDGMQIVAMFSGAYAWLRNRLDVMTRGLLRFAGLTEAATGEPGDEDIRDQILMGGYALVGKGYEEVTRCTGFVIRAYSVAGIDLIEMGKGKDNSGGNLNPYLVPQLKQLANILKINGSIRYAEPLLGDLVFFDHTWDANKNCSLGDDRDSHVGIVESILPNGSVEIVHAATNGVWFARLSLDRPAVWRDPPTANGQLYNDFLRNRFCVKCAIGEACNGERGCPAGEKPRDTKSLCDRNDFDDYGQLTGQLFSGYGTIRDLSAK